MKKLLVAFVTFLTLQENFVAFFGMEDAAAESPISSRGVESSRKFSMQSRISLAKSLKNVKSFVPIKKINGTNLYTGIYYRMGMKYFPQSWVTWINEGKYYVQVELDPNELPKYAPGREYQFDNQWTFGPTESEIGFTMTNRGKPYSYLVRASTEIESGHHVSIYDDPESRRKMSAGGEWRNDALWIVKATNEENYYKLENLAKPGKFLTWTWAKVNDFNHYIQLDVDYGIHSDFSFDATAFVLEARISDFKFQDSLENLLEFEENQGTQLVAKKRFPNYSGAEITSTLEESIQMADQFTISFKESSLAMIHKTSVSLDLLVASGSTELVFQGGFEANQEKSTKITKTVKLKTEIKIPPYTDIEATIRTVWAQNIEMPFTAKMEISGVAERIVVNHSDEVKEGNIPSEIVEDFINSSGGAIEGGTSAKIVSRSDETLIVSVSGTIKGNVGLKSIVSTAEVGDIGYILSSKNREI